MKNIDEKFNKCKEQRQKTINELIQNAEKRRNDPCTNFEAKYAEANTSLAAKEGLGKVFGKPKRMLQDQLKAEMSKCDEAQKALEDLLTKLKKLYEEYTKATNGSESNQGGGYFLERSPITLSLEIRKTLITLRNCIVKYAEYLTGFKTDFVPEALRRMTSLEDKENIDMTEEEQSKDEEAKLEELRTLGTIGYKAGTDKDVIFMTALENIETNIKDSSRGLYQGENAQYLQGQINAYYIY